MNSFRQYAARLARPYPLATSLAEIVPRAIGVGLFVWFFLWAFAPFGLIGIGTWTRLRVTVGYGLITTATMLLVLGLSPRLLPRLFVERGWTVAHHIAFTLINLLLIAAGNWAYTVALGYTAATLMGMIEMLGSTLLVGVFPVTAVVYLNQLRLERHYQTTAQEMGRVEETASTPSAAAAPSTPVEEIADKAQLTLTGTLSDEQLRLEPEHLLLLTAADNYVEVRLLRGGVPARVLLRQSLANIEQQLSAWPQFMRVHRSHVVNLARVQAVSGNAQGYRLQLAGLLETVPVARTYSAAVRARLQSAPAR